VPEVDDDQLAALRRLRAAFGPIQIIKVISNHPGEALAAAQGEPIKETRMAADPRRMAPEEHGEAHALLVKAVSDADVTAAVAQALFRYPVQQCGRCPPRPPGGTRPL
jgi:hypothetical protein